jgi:hypothetical protein
MNTAQIIQRIYRQLDGNPDLAQYKAGVLDRVNTAMQELLARSDWLFMQSIGKITTHPKVEGSSTDTVTVTNGSYVVQMAGTTTTETYWPGATFVGPDGEEYEIYNLVPASSTQFYIDRAYEGDTAAASADWAIEWRNYQLPADCRELLTIIDRTPGRLYPKLLYVSRDTEEAFNLQRSYSGSISTVAVDAEQVTDRAPDRPPTLAVSVGGSLAANTKYEYCYTFSYAGRESPPSEVSASATTTGVNKTITVSTMENNNDGALATGIFKNVYRRNVTTSGRWLKVASSLTAATVTYVDDNTVSPMTTASNELRPSEPFRQRVRLYPTPTETTKLDIRYLRRVRDLVSDSDVPEIPEPFQQYLIHAALRDICMQHGMDGQAQMYDAQAQRMLQTMAKTHLFRESMTMRARPMRMGSQAWPVQVLPWFGPYRSNS